MRAVSRGDRLPVLRQAGVVCGIICLAFAAVAFVVVGGAGLVGGRGIGGAFGGNSHNVKPGGH